MAAGGSASLPSAGNRQVVAIRFDIHHVHDCDSEVIRVGYPTVPCFHEIPRELPCRYHEDEWESSLPSIGEAHGYVVDSLWLWQENKAGAAGDLAP